MKLGVKVNDRIKVKLVQPHWNYTFDQCGTALKKKGTVYSHLHKCE